MSDTLELTAAFNVDPDRLADGEWNATADKYVGEGDMAASYSADRIAEGKPIRKPFEWQGALWTCVGSAFQSGSNSLCAYRLIQPQLFSGKPTTYSEKTMDADAARSDPAGFYNAMSIKYAGQTWILCGPPATFIAGEKAQMNLFAEP